MPNSPAVLRLFDEVIHTALADDQRICIRAIRSTDEALMRQGVARLSNHSRYLRFFSGQRNLPDRVIEKLVDVDGHQHLAWGAILTATDHAAIGAVHVFRDDKDSASGEFSVAILDEFHGMGLARMLTAVLLVHCRQEGISSLIVQILTENQAALGLVRFLGGERSSTASNIAAFTLETDVALGRLRAQSESKGLHDVLAQLEKYL